MDYLGFLFLHRVFKRDEAQIKFLMNKLKNTKERTFFVFYPEGTDFTPKKKLKSIEVNSFKYLHFLILFQFAKQNGLPKLNHLLLPRTKGLVVMLEELGNFIDSVYDVTIAYENNGNFFLF